MLHLILSTRRRVRTNFVGGALRGSGCLALSMLLTFVGCSRPTAAVSDVQQATSLLTSTLDAWKSGATLAEQRDKTPPVYVVEDLWRNGSTLKSFELKGPGQILGTNVRFQVELSCDSAGSSKPQKASYLVTTTPALTVAREEDGRLE